jgi:hypothetical protein
MKSEFIVLDGGEGFTRQLRWKRGVDYAAHIHRIAICIWTSHSNGDHHFALRQFLQPQSQAYDRIVLLISSAIINNIATK